MRAVGADVADRAAHEVPGDEHPRWHPLIRIAFRFCFIYFGLICLMFAQITFVLAGLAGRLLPDDAVMAQMRALEPLAGWVGRRVFGVEGVQLHGDSGSGDQRVIWIMVCCVLVLAMLLTVIWTMLDRRRADYVVLHRWFLVAMRFLLAGQLLWYGIAKVIPSQMPSPALTTLLQPYGDLTPMAVLWNQVGVSYPYEILLGSAEMLSGLLLVLPRTATVGALLSLVCTAQVFVLNMTYGVPVKILSLHLLLLSLLLLAPQAQRMANFFVLERPSEPATQPPLFRTRRANRIAAAVQAALGLWILVGAAWTGWDVWGKWGGGAPEPPLYGIWAVTEFTRDGRPVLPLTTDENRWQRIVFDKHGASYQRMDGTLRPAVAAVDTDARTIALTEPAKISQAQRIPIATFTFDQAAPNRLRLSGELHARPVTISLEKVDLASFPQRSCGFHWIQDYPCS